MTDKEWTEGAAPAKKAKPAAATKEAVISPGTDRVVELYYSQGHKTKFIAFELGLPEDDVQAICEKWDRDQARKRNAAA